MKNNKRIVSISSHYNMLPHEHKRIIYEGIFKLIVHEKMPKSSEMSLYNKKQIPLSQGNPGGSLGGKNNYLQLIKLALPGSVPLIFTQPHSIQLFFVLVNADWHILYHWLTLIHPDLRSIGDLRSFPHLLSIPPCNKYSRLYARRRSLPERRSIVAFLLSLIYQFHW